MKKTYEPDYQKMNGNDYYSYEIDVEYLQCLEEGLDVEGMKPVFDAINKLEPSTAKERMADDLFEVICGKNQRKDYPYDEPSDYKSIMKLCKAKKCKGKVKNIREKITGGWYGRVAGCLLGKTVEGIRSAELIPFLKATDNYPMSRYITAMDGDNPITKDFSFNFRTRPYADRIPCAPADDDTNYIVLALKLIKKYGKDFTPADVLENWIMSQPKSAYFTAERVALINGIKGYLPPDTASYKNKYREYIGAQIRVDYYGWINPGDPETAAEMAFRDASISHTKNGIYGAMYVAAMIASAAVTDEIDKIIETGLSYVPTTSRLYEQVSKIIDMYNGGSSFDDCIEYIHTRFDENTGYGWCHVIPNACIVTAALLYGSNDYSKSVCMAVQSCFDTDCNGATVGSILGIKNGIESIDRKWTDPLNKELQTELSDYGKVRISDMIEETLEAAL